VVIRAGPLERYMLSHDREHQRLDLTVYGGEGCESAPPAVLAKLRGCLDQMAADFGVKYRFEAHCEIRGELGWHPLEDELRGHHAIGELWLTQPAEPEPEPEEDENPHPPESEAPTDPSTAPRFTMVPMAERKFDFFINHCQKSGQDQCGKLALLLKAVGATVWYDMQAQDLTAQGMEQGVRQSRNVIIFLSDDVMGRPFCNAEQRWAKLYSCNLIGVVEKDDRHSPADFGKEKMRAPVDLKHILEDVEFIDYRRRGYEEKGMVEEIMRRGGSVGPLPGSMQPEHEPEPEPEPAPEPVRLSEGLPPQKLTLKDVADAIKGELGLDESLPMKGVPAAAAEQAGFEVAAGTLKAQLDAIATECGICTVW
jgi:hypothetical protein